VVVARDGVVFKKGRRKEGRKWFGLKVCPNRWGSKTFDEASDDAECAS